LRFECGDPVADHRERAAELAPGAVEAAFFGHREEDPQLVDGRIAYFHGLMIRSTYLSIWIIFIRLILNGFKPHIGGETQTRSNPMIELRPFDSLGAADHGWLDTRHHFSFADYRDPVRMNWGQLRVWN